MVGAADSDFASDFLFSLQRGELVLLRLLIQFIVFLDASLKVDRLRHKHVLFPCGEEGFPDVMHWQKKAV